MVLSRRYKIPIAKVKTTARKEMPVDGQNLFGDRELPHAHLHSDRV